MRRFLALIAICALTALPSVAVPTLGQCESPDASNDPAAPSAMGTPAACTGNISIGDRDYYAFEVTPDQSIVLQVAVQPGTTASLSLKDSTGADRSSACSAQMTCRIEQSGPATGNWVLGLRHESGTGAGYGVALVVGPGTQNPNCEVGFPNNEAPNEKPAQQTITPPRACQGKLSAGGGDVDWYAFRVSDNSAIGATMSSDGGADLMLEGPNAATCNNDATGTGACSVVASGGLWFVGVKGKNAGDKADYVLSVVVADQVDPIPSTCEPQDAPSDKASAPERPANDACTGRLASPTDVDVYKFNVMTEPGDPAAAFVVTVTPDGVAPYRVTVKDASDRAVTCNPVTSTVCSNQNASGGFWFITIDRGSAPAGRYALTITTVVGRVDDSGLPNTCESPADAGGEKHTATAVNSTHACVGRLSNATDVDVYTFSLNGATGARAALAVTVVPVRGRQLDVTVFDDANVNAPCNPAVATVCSNANASLGKWYIRVAAGSSSGGAYALSVASAVVQTADPVPNTCEPGGEAGSDKTTAKTVGAVSACASKLDTTADVDVYRFDFATNTGDLAAFGVTVVPLNGSQYDVRVSDQNDRTDKVICAVAQASACRNTEAVGGAWYIRVAAGNGTAGSYTLTVSTAVTNLGEVERTVKSALNSLPSCEPTDAPDAPPAQRNLPWSNAQETAALCRGSVEGADLVDVYRFRVPSNNSTVRVMVQPESQEFDVQLMLQPPPGACDASERDANGQCPAVPGKPGRAGQPDIAEKAASAGAKSGDWLVTISRVEGSGPYELGLHVQASPQ